MRRRRACRLWHFFMFIKSCTATEHKNIIAYCPSDNKMRNCKYLSAPPCKAPETGNRWQANPHPVAIVHKDQAGQSRKNALLCASRPFFHWLIQCRLNEPIVQSSTNKRNNHSSASFEDIARAQQPYSRQPTLIRYIKPSGECD